MGRRASFSSAVIFNNCLSPSRPCAATIPSSARCARNALITWVCCRSRRSRAMLHQPALLLGRFRPHKSHPRPANRLADRLRVRRVVFVALDVSLPVLRRHQTNLVTVLRLLTCPVVRGCTGLHAEKARRQSLEKRNHLAAPELLPDDHLLVRIDAVDLKHVLGDIQTDFGNLLVDASLMWFVATITLRRFVAGSGRRPPHQRTNPLTRERAAREARLGGWTALYPPWLYECFVVVRRRGRSARLSSPHAMAGRYLY